jgi:hypothetical protein
LLHRLIDDKIHLSDATTSRYFFLKSSLLEIIMTQHQSRFQNNGRTSNYNSTDAQIREINRRFGQAVDKLGRDRTKGTKRYQMEVEFAYLINDIKTSPNYIVPMLMEQARELIDTVNSLA